MRGDPKDPMFAMLPSAITMLRDSNGSGRICQN
jgi:hypothetical protein